MGPPPFIDPTPRCYAGRGAKATPAKVGDNLPGRLADRGEEGEDEDRAGADHEDDIAERAGVAALEGRLVAVHFVGAHGRFLLVGGAMSGL